MAAAWEITAAEFLQGSRRQNSLLPIYSLRQTNRLLWGTFRNLNPSLIKVSNIPISLRSALPAKVRAVISGDVRSSVDEESVHNSSQKVINFYRIPLIQESATAQLLKSVQTRISNQVIGLEIEQCFNIGIDTPLSCQKLSVLKWLLQETYEPQILGTRSFLDMDKKEGFSKVVIEVGPRLSFTTAWSANAVSICQACGLTENRPFWTPKPKK